MPLLGTWAFWENLPFLAKMAEILGILENGLLWLTLVPFHAEYATIIQTLQNSHLICANGWFLGHFSKKTEILVFPGNVFSGMMLSLFCAESRLLFGNKDTSTTLVKLADFFSQTMAEIFETRTGWDRDFILQSID